MDVNQLFPWFSTRSDREGSLIVKGEDLKNNNELRQVGEERRQQTLCDKRDNNFV